MQKFDASEVRSAADVLNAISIACEMATSDVVWFSYGNSGFAVNPYDSPHQLFKRHFPLLASEHPETR